jgi:hypothetical protein
MNRGAVYYPSSLSFLYQAVQNMANNHFVNRACPRASSALLDEIVEARRTRPQRAGDNRGKRHLRQSAEALGIVDAPEGSGLLMRTASRRGATSSLAVPSASDGTPSRRRTRRGTVSV